MNLYLIYQTETDRYGSYDSAVVCAETEEQARELSPSDGNPRDWKQCEEEGDTSWCSSPEKVKVDLLGQADQKYQPGVICASYNAG
jgi:hypothetical protein